ncbi:hypothetical protein EVAR_86757_1 [Eumeta japonica]|uniref:Uncharacterized protein n=1 Tax=Eumeta variegata TaxID=151549 RepID=A0A4C1W2W2_EUMVA|nr:hypothetical protein EVAR_86757_1 [Eumeta japonica]
MVSAQLSVNFPEERVIKSPGKLPHAHDRVGRPVGLHIPTEYYKLQLINENDFDDEPPTLTPSSHWYLIQKPDQMLAAAWSIETTEDSPANVGYICNQCMNLSLRLEVELAKNKRIGSWQSEIGKELTRAHAQVQRPR